MNFWEGDEDEDVIYQSEVRCLSALAACVLVLIGVIYVTNNFVMSQQKYPAS